MRSLSGASAASAPAARPKKMGMTALTPTPQRHVRSASRRVTPRFRRSRLGMGSSARSAELVFGRAHDQVDQHPERLLEVGLRPRDPVSAELAVEKVDQAPPVACVERDREEPPEEVVDDLGGGAEPLAADDPGEGELGGRAGDRLYL